VESIVARYDYLGNGVTHEWELWEPSPDWAVSVVRRVLADTEFRPTPSASACQFCGFTGQCALVAADVELHPTTDEEARRACEVAWATQARMDALKAALKDYTADGFLTYAGVPVAGKFPAKDQREKGELTVGVAEFVSACLAAGVPPEDYLKQDDVKLGKLRLGEFTATEDDPNPFGEELPGLERVQAMISEKAPSKRRTFRIDDPPAAVDDSTEAEREEAQDA
jgi:hypothetical protein